MSSSAASSLSVAVREAARKEKDAEREEEGQGLSSTGLSWLKVRDQGAKQPVVYSISM